MRSTVSGEGGRVKCDTMIVTAKFTSNEKTAVCIPHGVGMWSFSVR